MPRLSYLVLLGLIVLSASKSAPQGTRDGTNNIAQDSLDVLRPGDLIRLRIWREPDMSGDYTVDERGYVIFPRLGPLLVTNESAEGLRARLVSEYQVFLRNPSIEIIPLRRINVLGAVTKPGLYPVDPTMTIADALALAGGATSQGRSDKVELLRDGERITANLDKRTRIGDSPIRSGDQLWVPERNWAVRNAGLVSLGVSAAIALLSISLR
jgi:protein involved in polysaccharide export with SLBB domain